MSTVASPGSRTGSGGLASRRHSFREWRRGRPFWGCAIGIFAGVEIYLVAAAPLKVMAMQGLPGLLTLMIALAAIVLSGVTLFQPHLRTLTGIIVALLGPISILATNLGGFIIGMVLLIIAGALMVAWRPAEPTVEGVEAVSAPTVEGIESVAAVSEPATTAAAPQITSLHDQPQPQPQPQYSWLANPDGDHPQESSPRGLAGIMNTLFGAQRRPTDRPSSLERGPSQKTRNP